MIIAPEIPSVLDGGRCQGQASIRFEDVTQGGRLLLPSLAQALGGCLWPAVIASPTNAALFQAGIVPILSRMVLVGGGGPLSVFHPPVQVAGTWHSAHVAGPTGAPERLLLMMWADLRGREGWTHLADPPGAPVAAGQIYAEHVLTRLFAPPEERRVTRLDLPGRLPFPPAAWPARAFDAAIALPPGAVALAQAERAVVFGGMHTDPNQHVNSLVYPRLFEEAVLDIAAGIGRDPGAMLSRRCEMIWRKPFFAGEAASIALTLYATENSLGASGVFRADGRARCAVHLEF